jgi:diguanylate cyclase (GGDEF)-like protein/PAS domain S-box-containing protein
LRDAVSFNDQRSGGDGALAAALAALPTGIVIVAADGAVSFCNEAAITLLGLAEAGAEALAQLASALHDAQVLPNKDGTSVSLRTVAGQDLDIRIARIASSGFALVIQDARVDHRHDRARLIAEGEYESLFNNAVCGIYRDRLDGTPVRCNPALALLNGYTNEDEYIAAVTGSHGSWYVDPARSDEFKRLMREEGRVKDFISEVHRHRTRERFWITENAWFVRDLEGNPIFIEGTIQDATERIAALTVIEQQANCDNLTGVASRFRFFNEITRCAGPESEGCTLYAIDLDNFKDVNDLMGHAAGDHVLKVAAGRLAEIAGGDAVVARLGGDEFAILAPGQPNETRARSIARQIVQSMAEPIDIQGRNAAIGASVGIAMSPPSPAAAEELMRDADLALYEAKSAGRNGFRVFDAELRSGIEARKAFGEELRIALDEAQLELYFQPIASSATGEIEIVEALLRWNHPTQGLLLPGQFVPDAEDVGMMTMLGLWVIERACEHGVALPDDIRVAVNVSSSQMLSPAIGRDIASILARTGLAPARLIIEVNESTILASEAAVWRILADLKAIGVMIALDDFGTAYSSLSYLQRFPFDQVKIDRSFVASMLESTASAAIVRAVIGIGRDLGVDVVAEGVETAELASALILEGCKLMQGYHYGHPKPFADVASDLSVSRLATRLTEARDFAERLAAALRG